MFFIFWLSFPLKTQFYEYLGEKIQKIFPVFLVFLTKRLSKCPSSTIPLVIWKISCCALALRHCFFYKTLHLECLTAFWILNIMLCLDNWSVICTLTLYYVLHQTHSEFWHIQNAVYAGKCRYIQAYSALLKHIQAYWCIIKTYSGLFRHIQHPVEPSDIHSLAIFQPLAYLEPKVCSKPCEALSRHIWNPGMFKTLP